MKTRTIGGKLHVERIALVEESDARGKPLRLRLIRDDETVTIEQGTEFVTMLVPEESMRGRN